MENTKNITRNVKNKESRVLVLVRFLYLGENFSILVSEGKNQCKNKIKYAR